MHFSRAHTQAHIRHTCIWILWRWCVGASLHEITKLSIAPHNNNSLNKFFPFFPFIFQFCWCFDHNYHWYLFVTYLYPLLLARGGILYINTSGFTISTLSYSMLFKLFLLFILSTNSVYNFKLTTTYTAN